jgi:hypothetical protein
MIFNVNDRVILINTERLWGIDDHNPLWESKYKTVGTVTKITEMNPYKIKVKWDNGASNMYNDSHLSLYPPIPTNILPEELFEL